MSWTIIPTSPAIHAFTQLKWLPCLLAPKIIPGQDQVIARALTRLTRHGGQTIRFSFYNTFFTRLFLSQSNFSRYHSTPFDSLDKVAKGLDFQLDFLLSGKSSEKRIVWPGLQGSASRVSPFCYLVIAVAVAAVYLKRTS